MAKIDPADLPVNPKTGLVAVECLVSEAGFGLRAGEIRGFSPEVAATMISVGSAKLVKPAAPAKTAAPAS